MRQVRTWRLINTYTENSASKSLKEGPNITQMGYIILYETNSCETSQVATILVDSEYF